MTPAHLYRPTFIIDGFQPTLSIDGSITTATRIFEVRPTSRQFRFLRALATKKSGLLKREELIGAMYGDVFEHNPAVSMRRTVNRYQTAVKTLSRLRLELENFFGDLVPPGFTWLPWSERLGGWILFSRGFVDQSTGTRLLTSVQ